MDFTLWTDELKRVLASGQRTQNVPKVTQPLLPEDFNFDDVYELFQTGKTPEQAADQLINHFLDETSKEQ